MAAANAEQVFNLPPTSIDSLPAELLSYILGFLSFDHLKSALLVCRWESTFLEKSKSIGGWVETIKPQEVEGGWRESLHVEELPTQDLHQHG